MEKFIYIGEDVDKSYKKQIILEGSWMLSQVRELL